MCISVNEESISSFRCSQFFKFVKLDMIMTHEYFNH